MDESVRDGTIKSIGNLTSTIKLQCKDKGETSIHPTSKSAVNYCVNHRCYVKLFVEFVEKHKPKEAHLKRMSVTPFDKLLHIPNLNVNRWLLEDLISRHVDGNKFCVGGVNLDFSIEDVAAILGLPASGIKVKIRGSGKTSDLEAKYSKEKNFAFNTTNIQQLMIELHCKDDDESVDDFVKLLILLMCSTFLLPESGSNVPRAALSNFDKLENLKFYNWSEAIHSLAMEKVPLIRDQIISKKAGKRKSVSTYALGSSICFMVWLYEHINLFKPVFPELKPRFRKWASLVEPKLKDLSSVIDDMIMYNILVDENDFFKLLPNEQNLPPLNVGTIKKKLNSKKRREQLHDPADGIDVDDNEAQQLKKRNDELILEVQLLNQNVCILEVENSELKSLKKKVADLEAELSTLKKKSGNPKSHVPTFSLGLSQISQVNTNFLEETNIGDQQMDKSNLVDVVIGNDQMTSTHVPCDNVNVCLGPPPFKRVYKRKETVVNTSESSLTRRVKMRINRKPNILLEDGFNSRQASKTLVNEKVSLKGVTKYLGYSEISLEEKTCIDQFLSDPRDMSARNYRTSKNTFCIGTHLLDLLDGKMVSGDVLEVSFELLELKVKVADRVGLYCLFSYVYPQIKLHSCPDVLTDEMKKNLCQCFDCPNYIMGIVNYYFMILHTGSHWHLFVINFQQSRFQSYNSYNSARAKARVLQWSKWVAKYFEMMHNFDNMKTWEVEHVPCPQQSATSLNCGLYVLKFAEYLSEGKDVFDFEEADMARIRAEYVAMILRGTCSD